ncbi:MAG: type I glyceraldehyde-3-phosphate dehydrogenase, partial [Pirellulaceae bacterium]
DLTVNLAKGTTVDEINSAMEAAASGPMHGILFYATDPLVSSDIVGDPHSSIFLADFTQSIGDDGKMAKVVSWYDNEWGYSCRTADLVAKLGAWL